MSQLEKAGFVNRGGKGSHRNFMHAKGVSVRLCGNPGDDAKKYQMKDVSLGISEAKRRKGQP